MKKFNKIIAVLIVISILSSFAVSVSAATASGGFQLRFTDKDGKQITSANKGDLIDVYFAINTNGYHISAIQSDISYDVNLVKQTQANATTQKTPSASTGVELLGEFAYGEDTMIEDIEDPYLAAYPAERWEEKELDPYCYLAGYFAIKANPHKSTFYPTGWTAEQKAQYKIVRLQYTITYDEPMHCFASTTFEDVARLRFIAQTDIATLDGSVIGYCDGGRQVLNCDGSGNNESINVFMAGVEVMDVALSYAEAAPVTYLVNPVKNQIQWNKENENAVNIGVVAGFSAEDIKINFVNGISDNVTKIGTIYKINGEVQSPELTTNRVYSVNGGESYNFRIVLGNISTETTDTYSVIPYVVYNGETVYGPEIKITPDDVTTLVDRLS